MKTLSQHIEEKLIINRNFIPDETKLYNIVRKFIDEYVYNIPKNVDVKSTEYHMLFRSSIEISLNNLLTDNYIKEDVPDDAMKRTNEVIDNMLNLFKSHHIYRFAHGKNITKGETYSRVCEPLKKMYEDIEKSNCELEQIYNTKVNAGSYRNLDFFIECYDGDKIKLIHMGTELFAFTFIVLV